MTKMSRSFRSLLGGLVFVGLLGVPGCSDPEDFSTQPKAKVSKDDIQKAEFERDKAAKEASNKK